MTKTQNITAADLLTRQYLRLTRAHTVREVIGILGGPHQSTNTAQTNMMVVLDEDGGFAGLLDPQMMLQGLMTKGMQGSSPVGDEDVAERESAFWAGLQQQLDRSIAEMLWQNVPRLELGDRLPRILAAFCEVEETSALPVLANGQVEGLVYLGDLFTTVAGLVLGPQEIESPIRL